MTLIEYAVDSFPVNSCSKKRYFCGLKVHMIVTIYGEPVEMLFKPASHGDLAVLWTMNLPENSIIYANDA